MTCRKKCKDAFFENFYFREDIPSYRLNLEWSLNIPIAYRSTDAYAKIEVPKGCGVDPVLWQLPKEHIYLVEGDEHDCLVKLCFTDKEQSGDMSS